METEPRVKITERELYELSRDVILNTTKRHPMEFNARLMYEVSKSFRLMQSMEKPKAYWFHKRWHGFLLMTTTGFFLLLTKIAIETYWGIH